MVVQMSRSMENSEMKRNDKYTILEGIQDSKLDNVTVTSCSRRNTRDWLFDFFISFSESDLKIVLNNIVYVVAIKNDANDWNIATRIINAFISITELVGSISGEHKLVGTFCILSFRIIIIRELTMINTTWNPIRIFLIKFLSWITDEKGEITTMVLDKDINDIARGDWIENISERVSIT